MISFVSKKELKTAYKTIHKMHFRFKNKAYMLRKLRFWGFKAEIPDGKTVSQGSWIVHSKAWLNICNSYQTFCLGCIFLKTVKRDAL